MACATDAEHTDEGSLVIALHFIIPHSYYQVSPSRLLPEHTSGDIVCL